MRRQAPELAATLLFVSPSEPEPPPAAPRLLVFDPDRDNAMALAARLRLSPRPIWITVLSTREVPIDPPAGEIDVALISLADRRFDGLAFGGEICAQLPWVETVFWFDEHLAAPSAAAARSVGVRRVIPLSGLATWLDAALPSLAAMARARRAQQNAERTLPPLPVDPADGDALCTPLPEAERRFRETYLRRLLSESPSRAVAARRAGLPYTTFCSMLRKLDL